jgi:hypothetical protein
MKTLCNAWKRSVFDAKLGLSLKTRVRADYELEQEAQYGVAKHHLSDEKLFEQERI